jgi:hypothetical protein
MWVAEGDLLDTTLCHDQVVELRWCFEGGSVKPEEYVDTVDVLRRAFLPDKDDVETVHFLYN